MVLKLVFDDWKKDGESVYLTQPELSIGSFHHGTTFDFEMKLTEEEKKELESAIEKRLVPYFYCVKVD